MRKLHGRMNSVAQVMSDRGAGFAQPPVGFGWNKFFRTIDKNHDQRLVLSEFVETCRTILDLRQTEYPDSVIEKIFLMIRASQPEQGGAASEPHIDVDRFVWFAKLPAHELAAWFELGPAKFRRMKAQGKLKQDPNYPSPRRMAAPHHGSLGAQSIELCESTLEQGHSATARWRAISETRMPPELQQDGPLEAAVPYSPDEPPPSNHASAMVYDSHGKLAKTLFEFGQSMPQCAPLWPMTDRSAEPTIANIDALLPCNSARVYTEKSSTFPGRKKRLSQTANSRRQANAE